MGRLGQAHHPEVTLNTHGSNFDTLLAVYTGNYVSLLTLVAANDDDPAGGTLTSALTFNATQGVAYRIAVRTAITAERGSAGSIILNLL